MWDRKNTCQSCRGCCKFAEDETYFAPLFTKKEVDRIRSEGFPADCFKQHKNHSDVFQVILVRSLKDKHVFVCPYLNEETHLCDIYPIRPIDCKIWPLIMMRTDKSKEYLLGCFHQRVCTRTSELSTEEFAAHLGKLTDWFDKEGFIHHLKETPGLAWEPEPATFPVKTLNLNL